MSGFDELFIDNCIKILSNKVDNNIETRAKWSDGTPAYTAKIFGLINRYDLSTEFPIMTLRYLNFNALVDEILWIWQKKSNKTSDLSSKIWDNWADKDGTIGKAYGYQLAVKHKYNEGEFDQVDRILYDLKYNKYSRRIISNIYNHRDLSEMGLYPCAYSMTFNVTGNRLNGILNQRSQDMLVANSWNVTQYAILMHMFAISSGLEVGELVHVISDAHIYDRHIDIIKSLIKNLSHPSPKLIIDNNISDFYKFDVSSFKLDGYNYSEKINNIPVAI